jgi:hypothetical protein
MLREHPIPSLVFRNFAYLAWRECSTVNQKHVFFLKKKNALYLQFLMI